MFVSMGQAAQLPATNRTHRRRLIGFLLGDLFQHRLLQIPGLLENLLFQMSHRLVVGLDAPA